MNPTEVIPAYFLAGFIIVFGVALLAPVFTNHDED
jgi:hypothetical protein